MLELIPGSQNRTIFIQAKRFRDRHLTWSLYSLYELRGSHSLRGGKNLDLIQFLNQ